MASARVEEETVRRKRQSHTPSHGVRHKERGHRPENAHRSPPIDVPLDLADGAHKAAGGDAAVRADGAL